MEENLTMADLMEEIDKTMKRIHRGQILSATVCGKNSQGLMVNIGYRLDGLLPWSEVSDDEEVDHQSFKEGDTFNVTVVQTDNGEGNVLVSKKRAEQQNVVKEIEKMLEEKQSFTVRIKEVVKGGVLTQYKGYRAFIPASLLTNNYIEDLNTFIGKDILVEIIEFSPKNRRLVLSGKRLAKEAEEATKAAKLTQLEEGQKLVGSVVKLMPYGAFVDIGGVTGLVHINDLSWVHIKHPSDVVAVGDKVEVIVQSVDKEKGKISLSLKDMVTDPYLTEVETLKVGQTLPATITRFATFGAFAKLTDHVEGLIHISQMANKHIAKPEEVVKIGQEVKVKILEMNKEARKIALSMKQVGEDLDDSMRNYMEQNKKEDKATLGELI